MKVINVLLVDDHTVVRQALRALLNTQEDIAVVGEAENGRQAVMLARRTSPDVIVMDVVMPLLNGVEATRQILSHSPQTKVLVLSSYSEDEYLSQLIAAGASGYLIKQTAANDLLKAIHEVYNGNRFFSAPVTKRLRQKQLEPQPNTLSPREAEVLQLLAEGFSNKQIAAELGISIKTVEKHRQGTMDKLNIHDVAGLTRYAIARRMVDRGTPPL